MLIWSRLHANCQTVGYVLHIAEIKHIILRMIIALLRSHVTWYVDQNKVHISAHILSEAKLVLLHQISEVHGMNGAEKSHCFQELANSSSFLFTHS